MLGVMPTRDAQRLADQRGLDLVEITPNAQPPVCKIMDYGKFKYEESIREKQARKAQKVQKVKEIKFHPGTDTNDFNYKLTRCPEVRHAALWGPSEAMVMRAEAALARRGGSL